MLARLLAILAAGFVLLIGGAPAAHAACEGDPPTPKSPKSGMAGLFVTPVDVDLPAESDIQVVLENQPNPFTDENVDFVDVYGYGHHWGMWDVGCGPDAIADPPAVALNTISNVIFDIGLLGGASAQAVGEQIFNSPLDFLNSTVASTQNTMMDKIWSVWFPITIMMVGIYLLIRARRAELSETSSATLFAIVILTASVYFLTLPLKAVNFADQAMMSGIETMTSIGSDDRLEETMARSIYYPSWLEGALGSSTSAVAKEYGPELFWTQHYTWTEMALKRGELEGDEIPFFTNKVIDDAKADKFREIAEEIKELHPNDYHYLRGKESGDRLGVAIIAVIFAMTTAFLYVVAMAFLLLAMMVVRGFIVAFPLAGIVGAYPPARPTMARLWDILTAAIWNVLKFAFAAALYLVIAQPLLTSSVNAWWKIFILVVLTVAILMILRPIRALKTMTPGLDPERSRWRERRERRRWRRERDDSRKDYTTDEDQHQDRRHQRAEDDGMPPLPPVPDDNNRHRPEPTLAAVPTVNTPNGNHDSRDPHGSGTPPPGAQAPTAPTLADNDDRPSDPDHSPHAGQVIQVMTPRTSDDPPGHTPRHQVSANTGPQTGQHNSEHINASSAHATTGPQTIGSAQEHSEPPTKQYGAPTDIGVASATVHPVTSRPLEGQIVDPVYQRGTETPSEPVDMIIAEPMVDPDTGAEIYAVYRREQD